MLSQNELARMQYLDRVKALRDERSRMKHARQEGREEGRAEGRALLLEALIEERFCTLNEGARERLRRYPFERLIELAKALPAAQTLDDLGLDE